MAESSDEAKAYIKELCRRDPIFFINHFAWTFDPRADTDDRHRPFVLYDFQEVEIEEAEKSYHKGEDLLTEKSRDMGVSWIYIAWIVHKWLFEDDFNALLGSRKQDFVDNRQLDSLFGKIDYMLRYLPPWMLPDKFNYDKHRTMMKIVNPSNGNTIQGESTNPQFSRGGRYSIIFFDEFAHWEWADRSWTAAGDATKCRVAVSTPNGSNFFKQLRFSGKIKVRTIHWKLHPDKDENWYRQECQRRLPEEIAQELDINYERSQKGRIYEEFENVPYGFYPYNEHWPLYISWDYGLGDDTAMIWWQRDPMSGRRRIIDVYWNNGKLIDFYVPFVTGELPSDQTYHYTYDDMEVIEDHRKYKPAIHFGDPAGKNRSQAGGNKSVIGILKEHGIFVHTNDKENTYDPRRTKSKLLMRDLDVNDNPRTRYLRECMINARFNISENTNTTSTIPKPIHDWTSHLRSAFEYYAVNEREVRIRPPRDSSHIINSRLDSTILY